MREVGPWQWEARAEAAQLGGRQEGELQLPEGSQGAAHLGAGKLVLLYATNFWASLLVQR